ncbi:MAG: hypothetical protein PSV35_01705, partial [bacterium]|nr:hypothetical protein [bacterium]
GFIYKAKQRVSGRYSVSYSETTTRPSSSTLHSIIEEISTDLEAKSMATLKAITDISASTKEPTIKKVESELTTQEDTVIVYEDALVKIGTAETIGNSSTLDLNQEVALTSETAITVKESKENTDESEVEEKQETLFETRAAQKTNEIPPFAANKSEVIDKTEEVLLQVDMLQPLTIPEVEVPTLIKKKSSRAEPVKLFVEDIYSNGHYSVNDYARELKPVDSVLLIQKNYFDLALNKLILKAQDLTRKAKLYPQYISASTVAKTLCDQLQNIADNYFIHGVVALNEFKTLCKDAVYCKLIEGGKNYLLILLLP